MTGFLDDGSGPRNGANKLRRKNAPARGSVPYLAAIKNRIGLQAGCRHGALDLTPWAGG